VLGRLFATLLQGMSSGITLYTLSLYVENCPFTSLTSQFRLYQPWVKQGACIFGALLSIWPLSESMAYPLLLFCSAVASTGLLLVFTQVEQGDRAEASKLLDLLRPDIRPQIQKHTFLTPTDWQLMKLKRPNEGLIALL
jgi:hypothetical protein